MSEPIGAAPTYHRLAVAEAITAVTCGYLTSNVAPRESLWELLTFLHWSLTAALALGVAWGLWTGRRWAWFGAVALPGWVGLPTLASVAGLLHQVQGVQGEGPALVISLFFVFLTSGLQLIVLVSCLRPRGRELLSYRAT